MTLSPDPFTITVPHSIDRPLPRRRAPIRNQLARLGGALGKLRAGIPLGGERVWPGTANDLFVAHVSVYRFFARFASGKRVLDAGCGLGYGSDYLLKEGARYVLGVDIEPASIRHASKAYKREGLRFAKEDLERLTIDTDSFDLIVSSNVLEHLHEPERFLYSARRILTQRGELLIVVPPILNSKLLSDNEANPHHVSNLTLGQWCELFDHSGFHVSLYRHSHPQMESLDFSSHLPSRFSPDEFVFAESSLEELSSLLTLSAVFRLRSVTSP